MNQQTGAIICIAQGKGRVHDFRLFATSRVRLPPTLTLLADKGYQGIAQHHTQSQIPSKKPKGGKLSRTQRQASRSPIRVSAFGEVIALIIVISAVFYPVALTTTVTSSTDDARCKDALQRIL